VQSIYLNKFIANKLALSVKRESHLMFQLLFITIFTGHQYSAQTKLCANAVTLCVTVSIYLCCMNVATNYS